MSRIGVTYDDVSEAAAKLVLNGQSPTIVQVRQFLGTGSNTTIAKHLKAWRNQHQHNAKSIKSEVLPDSLTPLLESLWQNAVDEASHQLASKQTKWDNKRNALESMLASFEFELNNALADNETLERKLSLKKSEYDVLLKELINLKNEHRQFKQRARNIVQQLETENIELKRLLGKK